MWRKICHVEKFQIYMHDRCGEIWNFSTFGVISNFSTWQMWRNLTFLHMLSNFKFFHMTDVEKSEVSPHLASVWCEECLNICERYALLLKNWFYAVLSRNLFCRDLRTFVWRKNWTKDWVCGEKMTNIRYARYLCSSHHLQNSSISNEDSRTGRFEMRFYHMSNLFEYWLVTEILYLRAVFTVRRGTRPSDQIKNQERPNQAIKRGTKRSTRGRKARMEHSFKPGELDFEDDCTERLHLGWISRNCWMMSKTMLRKRIRNHLGCFAKREFSKKGEHDEETWEQHWHHAACPGNSWNGENVSQ